MRLFTLLITTSFVFQLSFGQNFNRPVPLGYPQYEFSEIGTITNDGSYLLTAMFPSATSTIRQLYVVDKNGYLQWYCGNGENLYVNFEYHANFELFSFASNANSSNTMKFYLMNTAFELADSVVPAFNYDTDIHEFRILDNGNYLITGTTQTEEDLSAYTFGNNPGSNPTTVLSFVIQEFEDGNLVFDWKSIDHIDPSEFNTTFPYNVNNFDYVHGNAVEQDSDGNFLVSMRHTNAIYKIDRSTGAILWTLGGSNSGFQFVNDNGFSGQHDIRVLDNGNVTLFDNGNSNPPPRSSRAVEYELDLQSMTATKVWEFYNQFNSYSRAMGSFRTYANGDKIVGYGFCNRPEPNMVVLNSQDEVLAELAFQDSTISYRAVRAEFTPSINTPEISCSTQNNEIVLTATEGYSEYRWNTGETTQSITVSEVGTHQVWTTAGIGLIGSAPFQLNDLNNACSVTSLADNETEKLESRLYWNAETHEIKSNALGTLSITNTLGQIIVEKQLIQSQSVNLSSLPTGIYFAKIVNENERLSVLRFFNN